MLTKYVSNKAFQVLVTIFLLKVYLSTSYFTGYSSLELRSAGANFSTDLQYWTASCLLNPNSKQTVCGSWYIMGGYDILCTGSPQYFRRQYTNLKLHNSIYFSYAYAAIDSIGDWDTHVVDIDNTILETYYSSSKNFSNATTSCGNSTLNDAPYFNGYVTLPHSDSSLTWKFITYLSKSTHFASFGFREVQILFANPVKPVNQTFCNYHAYVVYPNSQTCRCYNSAYFNTAANGCRGCAFECGACFGPTKSDCYSCRTGHSWNGTACVLCDISCPAACHGPASNQCDLCNTTLVTWNSSTCVGIGNCTSPLTLITDSMGYKSCYSPCASSDFVYWDLNCSSICDTTIGLNQNIISSFYKKCQYPNCTGLQRLFRDGTCRSECPAPLTDTTIFSKLLCTSTCSVGQYQSWDGTCSSTCNYSPRTENQYLICDLCAIRSNFFYQNGSCMSNCQLQFTPSTYYVFKTCNYPCSSSQYLYGNDSCLGTCETQFFTRTEGGTLRFKFCDYPCALGQFSFQNGTCSATCESSLFKKRIESNGMYKFCDFICPDLTYFYYTTSGKCLTQCDYPYTRLIDYTCALEISAADAASVVQATSFVGTTTTATATTATVASVVDAGAFAMVAQTQMVDAVRYINIGYPPILQALFDSPPSNSSIDMVNKIQTYLNDTLPLNTLPYNFAKFNLPSSFLINFWDQAASTFVFLVLIFVISKLTKSTRKHTRIHAIFRTIEDLIKWNLFFGTFLGKYAQIIIFSSLEFRTIQFDSFLEAFSYLLCLFINLIAMAIPIKAIVVVMSFRHLKSLKNKRVDVADQFEDLDAKLTPYKIVYEPYKDTSLFQQTFFAWFIARIMVYYGVIAYLYEYPYIQATIIAFISLMMMFYLVFRVPIKDKIKLGQTILQEVVLGLVNLSVLALAIMDYLGIRDTERREQIGKIIFYANMSFSMLSLVGIVLKLLISAYYLYDLIKITRRKKRQIRDEKIREEQEPGSQLQESIAQDLMFDHSTSEKAKEKGLDLSKQLEIVDIDIEPESSFPADNDAQLTPNEKLSPVRLEDPSKTKLKVKEEIKRVENIQNYPDNSSLQGSEGPNLMVNNSRLEVANIRIESGEVEINMESKPSKNKEVVRVKKLRQNDYITSDT